MIFYYNSLLEDYRKTATCNLVTSPDGYVADPLILGKSAEWGEEGGGGRKLKMLRNSEVAPGESIEAHALIKSNPEGWMNSVDYAQFVLIEQLDRIMAVRKPKD